jgi:hypothetical protein
MNHETCAAPRAHALCTLPDPASPTLRERHARPNAGTPSTTWRGHLARALGLTAALCTCLAFIGYAASHRVAERPDGNTVLVMGPRGKGLTNPTVQGTNCGVRTLDKAWLVVNFRAITMPAEERPDAPCASLDEPRGQ